MIRYRRVDIAENERGLLFRRQNFIKVLEPGTYRYVHRSGRLRVDRYDLTCPEFDHPLAEFLIRRHPELGERHLTTVELGDHEVGLCYVNGKLTDLIPPATVKAYWKGVDDVRIEVEDIRDTFEIAPDKVSLIGHLRSLKTRSKLMEFVEYAEVADNQVGLLFINGKLERVLEAGNHAFWKFNRTVEVRHLDCRVQALDVSGQEILTKDKVTLRINLTATYRVVDPRAACTRLADFGDHLYKEVQLALRAAVGTQLLDDLLAGKEALNGAVHEHVREKVKDYGIDIVAVGVKDIILPGEMKNILNQVVEAEKAAQANLIKRREETAATRALHNTARMMENNPTLLRLKELESLERVTERIDRITVFGGLDGVLQDLVRLRGPE